MARGVLDNTNTPRLEFYLSSQREVIIPHSLLECRATQELGNALLLPNQLGIHIATRGGLITVSTVVGQGIVQGVPILPNATRVVIPQRNHTTKPSLVHP